LVTTSVLVVVNHVNPLDKGVIEDHGPASFRDSMRCAHCKSRVHRARLRMEEDRAVEVDARPAPSRRRSRQQFMGHSLVLEHAGNVLRVSACAVVNSPSDLHQRLFAVQLQLAPQLHGPTCKAQVERIGVRAADNPGAAVGTAPIMAKRELFQ
jgi:hypothetical protein